MMKTAELDKKRQLHDINSRIYQIIDDLNELNVPIGLAIAELRNATKDIQKGIADLIDQESDKNK